MVYRDVSCFWKLQDQSTVDSCGIIRGGVVTLEDEKKTLEMIEEEEYEEVLTPEMIEERFRKLKEELSSKLKENEASIIEEEKD